MGKSAPSPPAAPDPAAVSAAQTQSNKDTALFNFGLNNPNVNTPMGSSSYSVSQSSPTYDMNAYNAAMAAYQAGGNSGVRGTSPGTDRTASAGGPMGAMPKLSDFQTGDAGTPQATQNITLSPDQQQLYDLSTSQSIDLAKLASALQGRVGDTLNQPAPGSADFATSSKNAQDAYYNNQKQFLDPQWKQAQEQLDSKLANQGITVGSEAYNNENNNFARQKQSAYDTAQNNAILQGPENAQQLFSLNSAARELPLTEFNALRTGAQPNIPTFQPTTPSMAAPTNTAQNTWNAYGAQQNAYNQQVASQSSMTGGLFSLAGAGASAYGQYAGLSALAASDIRLKENIIRIGTEKGIPVYLFTYKKDKDKIPHRGVMAHEVLSVMPQAVESDGEYFSVNYPMLGIEFGRVH